MAMQLGDDTDRRKASSGQLLQMQLQLQLQIQLHTEYNPEFPVSLSDKRPLWIWMGQNWQIRNLNCASRPPRDKL